MVALNNSMKIFVFAMLACANHWFAAPGLGAITAANTDKPKANSSF
jgi:hypothetical protein